MVSMDDSSERAGKAVGDNVVNTAFVFSIISSISFTHTSPTDDFIFIIKRFFIFF